MTTIIETMTGQTVVAEDYEDVRAVVKAYEVGHHVDDPNHQSRYAEFTLLSSNNQEERPVTIDLEKYVTHRPAVEEVVESTRRPAMVGDD